ncbi:MAG: TatD family deoxyribonuclease, partial [Thermoprotei archaeon]
PWEAHKVSDEEVARTLKLLERGEAASIGEVGLDKKFVPKTFERQLEIFRKFLKAAEELSLLVNIHAAGAWKEVLEELERHNIERAIFHWYTGPLSILEKIVEKGYMITVNPAVKIQNKMRKIVKETPLSAILTESDGPYNYRGINLTPEMIPDTVKTIAQIKGLDQNTVAEKIHQNAKKILNKK